MSHAETSQTSLPRNLTRSLRYRVLGFGVLLLIVVVAVDFSRGLLSNIWPDGPDQRDVRAVAISYAKALWDRDEATALGLAVDDPENRQWVERELATVSDVRIFSDAVAARFGPEAGRPDPYYDLGMSSRCAQAGRLPRLAVRIYEDSAIVCEPGSEPGDEDPMYELRRVGNGWRVWEVSPDTDILTKQMQVEMAEGAKALSEASRQVARDVAAGKYRTAQEAKTNLREALLRVSSGARSDSKTPGNP